VTKVDITSEQTVFDGLLVSLYLHLQDRQRLNGSEAGLADVEKRETWAKRRSTFFSD
jgi:hypothetical protein